MSLEWVKKGIKWILQEKAGPPYPALRPFMETKPFLSRFLKSITQSPSKILSTCHSCRNLRSSNTKSQESQAVRNYVLSLKNSTVAYLAYHRWNLLKKFANIFCVFPVSFTICIHNNSKMQKLNIKHWHTLYPVLVRKSSTPGHIQMKR